MKRIGQGKALNAFGSDNRVSVYGVYDTGVCIYEGYEYDRPDGTRWCAGLPFAGRNAVHLQPHVPLSEVKTYLTIVYF